MLERLELRRQIFHTIVGVTLVALIYFKILSNLDIFLILITGIIVSLISKYVKIPLISYCLDLFDRQKDKASLPGKGVIYFFVGSLLALKLFDQDIALAAIMILSLGDSVSHIVGSGIGKTKNYLNINSDKLIEGTMAGIVVGFFGALIFVSTLQAFLASLFAMIAELIDIKFGKVTINDNILIPLVAGTVINLLRIYF